MGPLLTELRDIKLYVYRPDFQLRKNIVWLVRQTWVHQDSGQKTYHSSLLPNCFLLQMIYLCGQNVATGRASASITHAHAYLTCGDGPGAHPSKEKCQVSSWLGISSGPTMHAFLLPLSNCTKDIWSCCMFDVYLAPVIICFLEGLVYCILCEVFPFPAAFICTNRSRVLNSAPNQKYTVQ